MAAPSGSITVSLPGTNAEDAERRRQIALKALNERHPSAPSTPLRHPQSSLFPTRKVRRPQRTLNHRPLKRKTSFSLLSPSRMYPQANCLSQASVKIDTLKK